MQGEGRAERRAESSRWEKEKRLTDLGERRVNVVDDTTIENGKTIGRRRARCLVVVVAEQERGEQNKHRLIYRLGMVSPVAEKASHGGGGGERNKKPNKLLTNNNNIIIVVFPSQPPTTTP